MEGIVLSLMSASVLLDTLEGIARVGCDDVNTVALPDHLGSIQFLYNYYTGGLQLSIISLKNNTGNYEMYCYSIIIVNNNVLQLTWTKCRY